MPPTFPLVAALLLLGLIGPLLAAGLLIAALFPSLQAGSLRALRTGAMGATAGVAANWLLNLALDGTLETITIEGTLLGAGMGFSIAVIVLRALSARREPEPPRVEVREDGVTLWRGDVRIATLAWAQVDRISLYRREDHPRGEIMLVFRYAGTNDEPMRLEVSEEWLGFSRFFDELPRHFADVTPGWFAETKVPSAKPGHTVLYDRAASTVAPELE